MVGLEPIIFSLKFFKGKRKMRLKNFQVLDNLIEVKNTDQKSMECR